MIVCTKCGLQNDPSDSFCGSCGSFLEWTGTKVEEAAPAPEPEPVGPEQPPMPEQPGIIGRVRDAVGLGGHAAGSVADAEATPAGAANRRDSEEAVAAAAAAAAQVAPLPVVVSGPRVFRIVDEMPAPEPEQAPVLEPAPAPVPEPAPEPAPVPEPAPWPNIESAPAPPPVPDPAPWPNIESAPAPEPALEPQPEPAPEPAPAPVPEPAPEPPPEAEPQPEPAPEPASAPQPSPEDQGAPQVMIRDGEPGGEAAVTSTAPALPLPSPGEVVAVPEDLPLEPAPETMEVTSAGEGPSVGGAIPPPRSDGSSPGGRDLEPGEPIAPKSAAAPEPAPAPKPLPAPEPTPPGPTCAACGRANPVGRVFCVACGERMPVQVGGQSGPATVAPALPRAPAREGPRIRPMLPGAAGASKPRALFQPSKPVEPQDTVTEIRAGLPEAAAAAMPPNAAEPPAAPAGPLAAVPPAASTVAAVAPATLTPHTPAQPPAQRPGRAQPPARLPSVPVASVRTSTPAGAGFAAAPVARTPTPPVDPDQPAARRPEAVKPGPERPRPASRPAREATPAPNPGDLVCGNCGIGNDPARKFCRRCGQSLATATVAPSPTVPWYRRIFGGGTPKAKVAAGERPKSMRTDGRTGGGINVGRLLSVGIQVLILAGMIGLVASYALVPSWRDAVNGFIGSIKEMIVPSADQVYTSGPTYGPGTKEHPARFAFDRTLGFWAAPFADGSPPTVQGSFTPPASVAKILVTAGAAGDQYKAFARPRDVTLELLDAAGTVIASKSYELKDQAEPQPFDVGAKGISVVRLTVRSIFPAEQPGAPVAISEVEFFGSQAGSSMTPPP